MNFSILIVDDEITDREALKRLIPANHSIVEAINGKSCIDILKNINFNLIFLDYVLPDYDGIELIKEIKSICDTPIILITGFSTEDLAITTFKSGIIDYINKNNLNQDKINSSLNDAIIHIEKMKTVEDLKDINEKIKNISSKY